MVDSPVTIIKSTASTVKSVPEKVAPIEKEKKIRIMLEDNEAIPPTGQYFGINGKGWLIRAGEPVDVPQGIIDILENAVMLVTRTDPVTLRPSGTSERLRFPYRIVTKE
jgi:hypothetical protein